MHIKKLVYRTFIFIVFLLSFRSYAGYLSPELNSDSAVHALMAHDLKLPEDLYYWGQNRLGSIVPILGHYLTQITSFSPIKSVSIAQFVFIYLGYCILANLFRNLSSKVIFALIWFFPTSIFTDLITLAHPYAPQFCFIGISIHLFLNFEAFSKNIYKNCFLIFTSVAFIYASLWISDFSIITLIILNCTFLFLLKNISKINVRTSCFLTLLVANLVGSLFIFYAKSNSSFHYSEYTGLNNTEETWFIVKKAISNIKTNILFQNNNFFLSLWTVLVFLLTAFIIYTYLFKKINFQKIPQLFYILMINVILGLFLLILSKWVFINQAEPRYFIAIYILIWISIMVLTESAEGVIQKKMYGITLAIAIISSLTLPSYVFSLEKAEPKIQQMQEIKTLGQVGIIGDYWTSYLIGAIDPELLAVTPHDKATVRCLKCVNKVIESETIYLVKEQWLENFPNQIKQFNHNLEKVSSPINLGGYTLAAYKKKNKTN
ncbi:hypothetical protein [Nostoc sp. MG11]|uniref:hypothetical protein n=1 Tax=Nostoc sp. MG11 TaxID=2721166 RepID=UPI00186747DD|nr:hypothetical protein [Nostoc sp. MG11]